VSTVWERLFANRPTPANDTDQAPFRYDTDVETSTEGVSTAGGFAERRGGESTPKSQKVARTFDSIGRRNEALRAQLDAIEYSFRNIEQIRGQFHEALIPLDQTLAEIERTKVAHVEAERKVEGLSTAHERLKSDHAALTVERNALTVKQEELAGRVSDLERAITSAEAISSEARAALAERTAKLERIERELEDNRRRLQTVSEQLPSIRTEFAAKEKRLQEVEQQRASLQDQHDLLTQEARSLRSRVDELTSNASKLGRQLGEMESRRDDAIRRIEELEAALGQETAAHAKLKAAHLDAIESHRLNLTNAREDLSAMSGRSEAAERLLAEARGTLRERDAAIRGYEQRTLESSLAAKSKDAALADLEKDLAAARSTNTEVEAARLAAAERSITLAKIVEDREAALHRAEQRIETLEARIVEQNKSTVSEREMYEEKIARLKEQIEAESAARAFAEGALQSARQERGVRLQDSAGSAAAGPSGGSNASPREAPSSENQIARDAREKITRLRG
jgi:crescentin